MVIVCQNTLLLRRLTDVCRDGTEPFLLRNAKVAHGHAGVDKPVENSSPFTFLSICFHFPRPLPTSLFDKRHVPAQ
jgi:hypothetical protein